MAPVTYPRIPESNWWKLRDQFKKTLPAAVTTAYVRSLLGLNSEGAARNLLGPLRQVGLVDDSGRPTPRANDWRNDAKYAEVCQEILSEVYPQELRDLHCGPDADRQAVQQWFMHNAQLGEKASAGNAAFYQLLNQTVPHSADAPTKRAEPSKATSKPSAKRRSGTGSSTAAVQVAPQPATIVAPAPAGVNAGPTIHVDLQIHVSPDAGTEQIDAMFAAMAKHLYGK